MFEIRLLNEPFLAYGEWIRWGILHADGFEERFHVPLDYWNEEDYGGQWRRALLQLIEHDEHAVALVTSMRNPEEQQFVFRWLLYREGEEAFLQQHVLFAEVSGGHLSSEDAQAWIPSRRTLNEEGYAVSEWPVALESIREFLGDG